MRRLLGPLIAAICLAGSLVAPSARAENEGQADLDKAMQLRLKMTDDTISLTDLSEVIRLTESAMEKGLAKSNRPFAQSLLASTLVRRGVDTAKAITHAGGLDSNWAEYRKLALADLERGVALDAKQPRAVLLIAKLNVDLPGGDAKRAAQAIDETIKLSGDDPMLRAEALVLRTNLHTDPNDKAVDLDQAAVVLAKIKKYDEAQGLVDKALALAPDAAVPLLVEKARIYVLAEKMKDALEALNKADAAAPDNPDLLLLRAGIRLELGQKDQALADVERVLVARPDAPDALRLRAVLLFDSKKLDAAVADLEKLHQLDPKDEPVLLELAMVYQAQKKYDKAVEVYSGVLRQHPDRWKFLRGRGDVLLSAGKRGEAITDFDKALAQQPKDINLLNNLAWVLATAPEDKLRDGKRALKLATQACELTGYKRDYILSTLAAAYAETGDFDKARKWAAKAVQLGGTSKEYGASLKKELASYQASKPWREALPEPEEKPAPKPEEKKAP